MIETNFINCRVIIKEQSSEYPFECIIRDVLEELDFYLYVCELHGKVILVHCNSVEWIELKKCDIIKFPPPSKPKIKIISTNQEQKI